MSTIKKNLLTILAIAVLILAVVFVAVVEIRVQKNWDRYEQKVFMERGIE